MKKNNKNMLCYIISFLLVATLGYSNGRKTGYNIGYHEGCVDGAAQTTEDVIFSLYGLKDDLTRDILCLLEAKYKLLQSQGINEKETTYSISELYVADLETESYKTFGESSVYVYRYWIVENSNIPINDTSDFSRAIYPNEKWKNFAISVNPNNNDNGDIWVDVPTTWKTKEKPLEGMLPLAYYLTDAEIEKGYLTESELEMIFIRINEKQFRLTLNNEIELL